MKELPYFFTCKPSDFFQYWTQKFKRFFQEKGGFELKKPKSNSKQNDSKFCDCSALSATCFKTVIQLKLSFGGHF